MKNTLAGQVALVTGSSRGIGREIARQLARAGATVAINYKNSAAPAEQLVEEIEKEGGKAEAYQADVSYAFQMQAMVEEIHREFGPITILVNNAGITLDRTFNKMTRAEWEEVVRVNLGGPFNAAEAVLPDMLEAKWGRIVNVSSIVGQTGSFGQANYAATKAGLVGWTKTLAREYARKNITVNAIAPGYIDTDMTAKIPEPVKAKITETVPLGRFGTPEEIAPAVVFLASPDSRYSPGQVIAVNGGRDR